MYGCVAEYGLQILNLENESHSTPATSICIC